MEGFNEEKADARLKIIIRYAIFVLILIFVIYDKLLGNINPSYSWKIYGIAVILALFGDDAIELIMKLKSK